MKARDPRPRFDARAVLLAAGIGERLRPLTNLIPKCLAPIRDRPLLDYWLDLLLNGGVSAVLVNTYYHANVVRSFVEASRWRDRVTLTNEDRLLGTGGTLLRNRRFCSSASFFLIHADNLSTFDPVAMLRSHESRPKGTELTMMVFRTPEPENCGIVVKDEQGIVREFYEKSPMAPGNLANAAVYIAEPSVLEVLASLGKEVIDFSVDVLPRMLGRIHVYENKAYHRDIGSLRSWRQAQRDFPAEVGHCDNLYWEALMDAGVPRLRAQIASLMLGDGER